MSNPTQKWTPAEDEILKENYPTASWDALMEMLPGRGIEAIRYRANKGFRLVRANNAPGPNRGVPKAPKTPRELKEAKKPYSVDKQYTWNERKIIQDFGLRLDLVELQMLLPKRSIAQIRELAYQMDIQLKG
jgi:hypothetical protein